ncbi:MAG: hypothetical protein K9J16_03865 [Melioribacteraceae bacterium]|nr:hypothetical protein [Melioribacteraceae bacterium]MCF8354251.1 hypothetical protein [Melioribacteraceae bacterium]MCF8394815.1 hypothetical protein [Melioribacteraceae bacterium]MCF8417982.1 hypothetical protein [Melioribacteraceae bacterium]
MNWQSVKRVRNIFFVILSLFSISCNVSNPTEEVTNQQNFLEDKYLASSNWYQSSVPFELMDEWNVDMPELMNSKANAYWFNITPSAVSIREIIDSLDVNMLVPVLYVVYDPNLRGCYNPDVNYTASDTSWGSVITNVNSDDLNSFTENLGDNYLSLWLWNRAVTKNQSIFIDLGLISEDVIPDNKLSNEDLNDNDVLDIRDDWNEDRGIDGYFDIDEYDYDVENNLDPSNDNYSDPSTTMNYERANFPEGNKRMDSEDINNNFSIDRENDFYTYKVPLDTSGNMYLIDVSSEERWMKLHIPLDSFINKIGEPKISNLKNLRIWFKEGEDKISIQIAEIKFLTQ